MKRARTKTLAERDVNTLSLRGYVSLETSFTLVGAGVYDSGCRRDTSDSHRLRALFCGFRIDPNLMGLLVEVVNDHDGIAAPVVAHRQHGRHAAAEYLPFTPADFRTFFSQADHASRPVEQ